MELFNEQAIIVERPQLKIELHRAFLNPAKSSELFNQIRNSTNWKRDSYKLFGREVLAPRLSCFYAEKGVQYVYSGMVATGDLIPDYLQTLVTEIAKKAATKFNSVLINYYKNGLDYMGWHADNEPELGKNPIIASLNLGASRKFQFKHRTLKNERLEVVLNHGDLLFMLGETQHFWLHQLPKTKKVEAERINLTFRQIHTKP